MGQFVYVIRKRIKLSPEKAIFIYVEEVIPPTAALMSSIYEEHKDEDGFLYITYVFFFGAFEIQLVCRPARANLMILDTRARTLLVMTCRRPSLPFPSLFFSGRG